MMKTTLFAAPRRAVLLLVVVAALLLIVPGAYAKIRTEGGGDVPFYARLESEDTLHTDEWAPIVFYRPPECVPDDFNLLDFYDWPDDLGPGAFGCTSPTTDGFMIWDGEPGLSPPIQIKLNGLGAVPVWFVAWPELQAAMEDGELTMADLEAMHSLMIGLASIYTETLHPTGVVKVPMINYVASGTLDDGRSFHVHALLVSGKVTNISIEFK
jgi:hypothetical protein